MGILSVRHEHLTLELNTETSVFRVLMQNSTWEFADTAGISLQNKEYLLLTDAECEASYYQTGTDTGIRAVYKNFVSDKGKPYPEIVMHTYTAIDNDTGELRFNMRVEGDKLNEVQEVLYPAPMVYGAEVGHGYSVLPRQQGELVMAGTPIQLINGVIFDRDGFMPMFGQIRDQSGYLAIFHTPWDVRYFTDGKYSDRICPLWRPSMGYVRYVRRMIYRFYDTNENPTYVTFAKAFRTYLKERGQFVSLKEKFARNPKAEYMLGAPIVHFSTAFNYSPDCGIWQEGMPRHGNTPFITRAKQLEVLHERGLEKAYIHVDGWGVNGYDNQHPDTFPINEEAGGVEGFKTLEHTTRDLGYLFGIHDQYRDYYYDARTFSFDNALLYSDGTHPYYDFWDGGKHTWLCASLAPAYVRRNYREFDRLGIQIDGSYLDVFSIVELDECTNPDHPMSRKECVEYRSQCIEYLNQRGIISSSEEAASHLIPSLIFCHHAPYSYVDLPDYDKRVPVPLLNLVFHDSLIVPWFGLEGKTVDKEHLFNLEQIWGYLAAMLNAGTIYVDMWESAEVLARLKPLMELHKRVGTQEMTNHEFLSDDRTVQRTTFADGTQVTVDYKNETWKIDYPEAK